ncbi:hypothetical protein MTR67_030377 [Solanum verrucosum]|uniref:CW-type domain-containing protein n=1 Tax=Solanum verrucosum TaxID=315347 RepID=A0AAF0RAW8_SOLVR|nr:hypothetical protein MTR67_030377 [Solanum verrucosum]
MEQNHQNVFTPRKIHQNNMHGYELTKLKRQVVDEEEFVVQCGRCFKWRYIPTKERYEKITKQMLEHPFCCEDSREWCLNISWNDTPDITQNERKLWAFDKPSIPQFAFMLSDIRCIIT